MGGGARAASDNSVAIGTGARASGGATVAIGLGNVASGNGAVAIGDPNLATGREAQGIGGAISHRLNTEDPFAFTAAFAYASHGNNAVRVGFAGEF